MWFALFMFLSFSPLPVDDTAGSNPRISCWYDERCLRGECWVGWCGEDGYCKASWNCA